MGTNRGSIWETHPTSINRLKELIDTKAPNGHFFSALMIARQLTNEYKFFITASAVIGKVHRMGFQVKGNRSKYKSKNKQKPRPLPRLPTSPKGALKSLPRPETKPIEVEGGVGLMKRTGCAFPVGWNGQEWTFCNKPQECGEYCYSCYRRMRVCE